MASLQLRRQKFWVQYFLPGRSKPCRESLGTGEAGQAALMKEKLELLIALGNPRLCEIELPQNISKTLRLIQGSETPPSTVSTATKGASIITTLGAYCLHIKESNHPRWVSAKLKVLSALFGTALVERASGIDLGRCEKEEGVFFGRYLEEIDSTVLASLVASRKGRDKKAVASVKTKRHYREVLHDFFEYCLSHNLLEIKNAHTPNPVGALPTYLGRENEIVFLNDEQIAEQYRVLAPHPCLLAGVRIMIETGLRRAEALWLSKEAFSADFSRISIVTRFDSEADCTSALKTAGSRRTVTLSDSLRAFLPEYLATLKGRWVIPSPRGKRWDVDNFSNALRKVNKAANLPWRCGHYRHTFATRKAFVERWSAVRLARVMGTSLSMIDKHYAGFWEEDA